MVQWREISYSRKGMAQPIFNFGNHHHFSLTLISKVTSTFTKEKKENLVFMILEEHFAETINGISMCYKMKSSQW